MGSESLQTNQIAPENQIPFTQGLAGAQVIDMKMLLEMFVRSMSSSELTVQATLIVELAAKFSLPIDASIRALAQGQNTNDFSNEDILIPMLQVLFHFHTGEVPPKRLAKLCDAVLSPSGISQYRMTRVRALLAKRFKDPNTGRFMGNLESWMRK